MRTALIESLRTLPEPAVALPDGCYRLIQREGVDDLVWQPVQEKESPNAT